MIIKYNTELLNRIIKNIHTLTGISISVLDTKYNSLARCTTKQNFCCLLQSIADERMKCRKCDNEILKECSFSKKMEKHICFAGLYDSAMPIIKDNIVVGFVIMGRVRSAKSPHTMNGTPNTDSETINQLEKSYSELPFITEEKLSVLYDLFSFIVFENAIQIVHDHIVTEVVDFIDKNFQNNLSVNYLCSKFHISKNRLYKVFNDNLGSTVNMYITEKRLNYAKELLLKTNDPVYLISQNSGIENYAYFCRLFKEKNGVTPTQYRKMQNLK